MDARILEKIKKCLALATSDNANEAATALRQAHALMDKHGVSAEAVTMADIGEAAASSQTMAHNKPAHWEAALASMVGKAFGCKMMLHRMVPKEGIKLPKGSHGVFNEGGFVYVGLRSQVAIAAYTTEVLVRKCKKARANWIRDNLSGFTKARGGRHKATLLGDEFAMGWVAQIARVVHDFAHPPEVDAAIDRYIKGQVTSAEEAQVRSRQAELDRISALARRAGQMAAEGESIHRPMKGADAPLALTQ